jgi:hypothetical protein
LKVTLNPQATQIISAFDDDLGSKTSGVHVPEKLLCKDANLAIVASTRVDLDLANKEAHCRLRALRSTKIVVG